MPWTTCTTRSPSFRSRKSAPSAPKVRGRRGVLRVWARGPKTSSSEKRASRECRSTNPALISPTTRWAWTCAENAASRSGTICAIRLRSSSRRRVCSACADEWHATITVTPRSRSDSSRRTSGDSAPSSPWWLWISARRSLVGRQRQLALLARLGEGTLQRLPQLAPLPFQLQRVVEHPDSVLGQILGEGRKAARIEPGQDRGEPGREERVVLRRGGEVVDQLAQLARGRLHGVRRRPHGGDRRAPALLVQDDLAGGAERELLQLARGALRLWIERPDLLHQVAEELQPGRLGIERRPDVEDAAANRIRAGILDQGDLRVSGSGEHARELVAVLLHLEGDLQAAPVEGGAGEDAAPDRLDRADHDGPLAEMEAEERRHPLLRDEPVRSQPLVGEDCVRRDAPHRPLAGKEAQVALQRLGCLLVGVYADERPLRVLDELGERVPPGSADEPARLHLADAAADGGEQLGESGRAALRPGRERRSCGCSRFQSTRPPPRFFCAGAGGLCNGGNV